jgi:tetratricopeptide (TPR) repeat protein
MSKNPEIEDPQSIAIEHKLSAFLAKNAKVVITITATIVAVLVILLVVNVVSNNSSDAKVDEFALVQTEYVTVLNADKESSDYQANIDASIAKFVALEDVKGYVGEKSTFIVATNSFNNQDYQAALDDFLRISESATGTYFGSLALSNAITCAEELGDNAKVIEYCQSLIDTYGNEAAESPRTMFTLARTYESNGDAKLAQSQFQQLADQFPSSEYGKLAQNSLLNY